MTPDEILEQARRTLTREEQTQLAHDIWVDANSPDEEQRSGGQPVKKSRET